MLDLWRSWIGMHRETPSHCDRTSKLPAEAAPSAAELTRTAEHDGAAN